ncbi:MAG: NADH-quinone oxidoreductase subunit J [Dehalococcoidia bacterium]|nr:NADH-quinone oxidoreductase subunit J [Dehalococcoidia bacterium]
MATEVLWWIFAAAIVGASAGVVFSRSVLHSAIFLIGSMAGVGAMYVFLTVEFLALVQFLIYGGAVTVLILLALMLTRRDPTGQPEPVNGPQLPFALLLGISLVTILVAVALDTAWGDSGERPANIAIETVSERMFSDFGVPFILASVLLLVALIGAVILARQEEGE